VFESTRHGCWMFRDCRNPLHFLRGCGCEASAYGTAHFVALRNCRPFDVPSGFATPNLNHRALLDGDPSLFRGGIVKRIVFLWK
jgi:hypothetical protein